MTNLLKAGLKQRRRHMLYRERDQTVTDLDDQIVAAVADIFRFPVAEILPLFVDASRGPRMMNARVVLIGVLAHWRCLTNATIARFLGCRDARAVSSRVETWLSKSKAERLCWIEGIRAVVNERIKHQTRERQPA